MNWLASLVGPLLRGTAWFFIAVVIPATTWFVVLRFDSNANAQDIAEVRADVVALAHRVDSKEERLIEELKNIQRSLGRIEGQLRHDRP